MSEPTPETPMPSPNDTALAASPNAVPQASPSEPLRSTTDFPADPAPLSRAELEGHYIAMRRSHEFLSRSRGQLKRRSNEYRLDRDRFFATMHAYEEKLTTIGREKAELMEVAQGFQHDLKVFESKQKALDQILDELDVAKEAAGFWSIFNITRLIEKMRQLLRGSSTAVSSQAGNRADG